MACRCGNVQKRTEEPFQYGLRRITLECNQCYFREIETRTANGALIRWRHDYNKPVEAGDKKYFHDPAVWFLPPGADVQRHEVSLEEAPRQAVKAIYSTSE